MSPGRGKETCRSRIFHSDQSEKTCRSRIFHSDQSEKTCRSRIFHSGQSEKTCHLRIFHSDKSEKTCRSRIFHSDQSEKTCRSRIFHSGQSEKTCRSRIFHSDQSEKTCRSRIFHSDQSEKTCRSRIFPSGRGEETSRSRNFPTSRIPQQTFVLVLDRASTVTTVDSDVSDRGNHRGSLKYAKGGRFCTRVAESVTVGHVVSKPLGSPVGLDDVRDSIHRVKTGRVCEGMPRSKRSGVRPIGRSRTFGSGHAEETCRSRIFFPGPWRRDLPIEDLSLGPE